MRIKLLVVLLAATLLCRGEESLDIADTLNFTAVEAEITPSKPLQTPYRFKATDVIAPAVMIGVGVAGLEWKGLKHVNSKVEDALWNGRERNLWVDNVTQFLPAAAVYGLNLCGVKGLHDYVDATIILGSAYLIMATIVYPVKDFVSERRPNGKEFNSFPSGHCGWAFAGAEVLRREYWHVSPWIGVSGYLIAAGTGFMRLYQGAHWLTDVLAGAGIGILSAEAAYWLYPAITKALFPKQYNSNIFLSPVASVNSVGLSFSMSF